MDKHTDTIAFLINNLSRKLHKNVMHKLENYNINRGQVPVLFILKNYNGLTQKEIAAKLKVTQATMCKIIQRMEKNELIDKKIDPNDKRNTIIYLSNTAIEIQNELEEIYQVIESDILSDFNEEEIILLKTYLNRISSKLETPYTKKVN